MLNEIRVGLMCATVFLTAYGPQQGYVQQFSVPVENDYVKVTVAPQSFDGPGTMNLCFNGKTPFVELYFPAPKTGTGDQVNLERVLVTYIDEGAPFGCSPTKDGTFISVELKLAPAKSAFTDDAVKADPLHNEVLSDNDRYRVVRIHFGPGEVGPMVDKRARVVIARTDSHATVTFPDGHSEPREMKAGAVSFGNAGRQATKNTGTTTLENIVVELKSK